MMDFIVSNVILGDYRLLLIVFFLCGVIMHFIDYKYLLNRPENAREVKFSHVLSRVYIWASIGGIVVISVISWVV
jgi:hypothetical protein